MSLRFISCILQMIRMSLVGTVCSILFLMGLFLTLAHGELLISPQAKVAIFASSDCSGQSQTFTMQSGQCNSDLGFPATITCTGQSHCMKLDVWQNSSECHGPRTTRSVVPNQCSGPATGTTQYLYEACEPDNKAWRLRWDCAWTSNDKTDFGCSNCKNDSKPIPVGYCYPEPYNTQGYNASYILRGCIPCETARIDTYPSSTSCQGDLPLTEVIATGKCYPWIPTGSFQITCSANNE